MYFSKELIQMHSSLLQNDKRIQYVIDIIVDHLKKLGPNDLIDLYLLFCKKYEIHLIHSLIEAVWHAC